MNNYVWHYFLYNKTRHGGFYGQAKDTRKDQRHKDTVYTKVLSEWDAHGDKYDVYWYKVPSAGVDKNGNPIQNDKKIHKRLKYSKFIRGFKTEYFVPKKNVSVDEFESHLRVLIDEEFGNHKPDRTTLSLYPHQREFLAKVQAEYLEFLLFAKCRAGKSIMVLSHLLERKARVSLVVARFTSPKQSWAEDSLEFDKFTNMVFIDLQGNKNYNEQISYWVENTDKQIVLFDTVQGFIRKNLTHKIDHLVYDEAHVGAKENKKQWAKLKSMIDCPILYVTGTAYKMVDNFTDSNKYEYSYFQEQLDRKKGLNKAPQMNVILAKYQSSEYQKVFGDDPDALKNLFQTTDGKFNEPSLVEEFVSKYFVGERTLRNDKRLLNNSKNLFITLPSIDACHAFAELLKGTRFSPLVVTSDTKNTSKEIVKHIEDIEDHIDNHTTGSAIITQTANVLGVTANVDTVINCSEGSSIEFWTQFAFRGGSGKNDWRVIDFVPQRCLNSLREMYLRECESNPEISEYELGEFTNITEWDDGFVGVDQETIERVLASDPSMTIRNFSSLVSSMSDDILSSIDFIPTLTSDDNNVAKNEPLNDNGSNGKSAKTRISDNERDKEIQDNSKKEHVRTILERLPLTILHLEMGGVTVNTVDQILDSNDYKLDTQDSENVLGEYLKQDQRCYRRLSNIVGAVSTDIRSSMKNDMGVTLDKLSITSTASIPIPSIILKQMIPSPHA